MPSHRLGRPPKKPVHERHGVVSEVEHIHGLNRKYLNAHGSSYPALREQFWKTGYGKQLKPALVQRLNEWKTRHVEQLFPNPKELSALWNEFIPRVSETPEIVRESIKLFVIEFFRPKSQPTKPARMR